jgi:hypothetical protein
VRPTERVSKFFHYYVDIQIIDGIVNGVASVSAPGVPNSGKFRTATLNTIWWEWSQEQRR